jgi:hypothetical protein
MPYDRGEQIFKKSIIRPNILGVWKGGVEQISS